MSADGAYSRRGFIAGAVAAGSGLALLSTPVDMTSAGQPQLFLFDAERADACRNVAGNAAHSCEARAIVGDRVRFALDLFAAARAPDVVAGVSTYADFILLSGTAAEHGYRVLEESAQGPLVSWRIARLRRPTSSG
jgi:hypothetical protein